MCCAAPALTCPVNIWIQMEANEVLEIHWVLLPPRQDVRGISLFLIDCPLPSTIIHVCRLTRAWPESNSESHTKVPSFSPLLSKRFSVWLIRLIICLWLQTVWVHRLHYLDSSATSPPFSSPCFQVPLFCPPQNSLSGQSFTSYCASGLCTACPKRAVYI